MTAKQNTSKTAQKIALKSLQATRGTAATASRGFKRANPELEELIRFANLVPPGTALPALDVMKVTNLGLWRDFLAALPPLVRLNVLDYVSRPEEWPQESRLSEGNDPDWRAQSMAGMVRYTKIREAHENLNEIIRYLEHGYESITHPFVAVAYVKQFAQYKIETNARGEKKIRLLVDPFTKAIQDVDLRYLRKCPICDQLFFAVRSSQKGCGPSHSSALYKRNRRASKSQQREAKKALAAGKARAKARKRKAK